MANITHLNLEHNQIGDPGMRASKCTVIVSRMMLWFFFCLLVCATCAMLLQSETPTNPCSSSESKPPRGIAALPDNILENISDRVVLVDALALRCTCRAMKTSIDGRCDRRISAQHQRVIRYFPEHVLRSLPMAVWLDVEWVDFDPAWLGQTGYIDRVTSDDLPGRPYKCCRDSYGRLALMMRRKHDVAVLFQRYTDTTATWAFASDSLPIGGCRLSDSMVARLALWLSHDYADFRVA